ncbi:MAG: exonuclease SbcCD subunit D, partial [Oscillospiraceae bacterium]|nr:exonuclease SbcCD subunit D [Oscillospiraceae bacterium]
MKIVHLSDLHLGKRLGEFSLAEDQAFILKQILDIINAEAPDAVIIAGDVYDKTVPPAEAVQLFSNFITAVSRQKISCFIISGNHDSPERIAFGSEIMSAGGVHLSPVYNGTVNPVAIDDEFGRVNFYMLPFVKPSTVRRCLDNEEIQSYGEAVAAAVEKMNINKTERNVLITHQFVTGAELSDSEDISAGGSESVPADIFSEFDYTALGHIHRPQNIGSEKIRYCGTPLKYSFSEANQQKSVTVAVLGEKGILDIKTVPITPLHDMVELRGSYDELTDKAFLESENYGEDYVRIILTDEEDVPDALAKLRLRYHNLMRLDYDNKRTHQNALLPDPEETEDKPPIELFSEFFEFRNNQPMNGEQRSFMEKLINEIW